MKKTNKVFVIIALVAIIGFSMITCDNGNQPQDPSAHSFAVSGTFNSLQFELYDAATVGGSHSVLLSRAVTAESYRVDGYLKNGSTTYRLKGTYNPGNRSYVVSTAKDDDTYIIDGTFNTSGNPVTTNAAHGEKSGDDIDVTAYTATATSVTIDSSDKGSAVGDTGGLPPKALGYWWDRNVAQGDAAYNFLVTQWGLIIFDINEMGTVEKTALAFVEMTPDNNPNANQFDVIFTSFRELEIGNYYKFRLAFASNNTSLTITEMNNGGQVSFTGVTAARAANDVDSDSAMVATR